MKSPLEFFVNAETNPPDDQRNTQDCHEKETHKSAQRQQLIVGQTLRTPDFGRICQLVFFSVHM